MGFQRGDDEGWRSISINDAITPATTSIARIPLCMSVVTTYRSEGGQALLSSGVRRRGSGWLARYPGFLTVMSGLPLYFSASSASLLAPGNTQTPDLVAQSYSSWVGLGNPGQYVELRCSSGEHLRQCRTQLFSAQFFQPDASIAKSIRFTERLIGAAPRGMARPIRAVLFRQCNGTVAGVTLAAPLWPDHQSTGVGNLSFGQMGTSTGTPKDPQGRGCAHQVRVRCQ